MKVKKILSAVISAAMCFSMFATNVSANNEVDYAPAETTLTLADSYGEKSVSSVSGIGTTFRYEDISQQTGHISVAPKNNSDSGITTYAENSAPVAGLTNMVVNPETMLNGKLTTETVVYWLWYDGETYYSYDPDDGDEITNYLVDGINSYILGNVTLNGQVIGFATQITKAAEHDLYFQVVDSNGAYSNVLNYTLEVEPSDGNTRPVCRIITATPTPYTNDNVFFDWSTSSDADGDQIIGYSARVYHNGSYETVLEDGSSSYFVSRNNYGITLRFSEAGTYQIWISLCDNKNAWSNWTIGEINVQDKVTYDLEDVVLTSKDVNNTDRSRFTWYNYLEAIELQDQTSDAQGLYDLITSNEVPDEVRRTTIIGAEWTVSGYVKSSTGEPVANATVQITIPINEGDFNASVTTNSLGYFSYTCSSLTQWFNARNVYYQAQVPVNLEVYGGVAKWCRYGDLKTTSWYQPTTMKITCKTAGVLLLLRGEKHPLVAALFDNAVLETHCIIRRQQDNGIFLNNAYAPPVPPAVPQYF